MSERKPFSPGYGSTPEALVGRDEVRERLRGFLASGGTVHHALYGPRGMGKTVLLTDFARWAAEDKHWHVVRHQLSEDQKVSVALVDRLTDPSRAMSRRWDRLVKSLRSNLSVGISGPLEITKRFDVTTATGPEDTLLERALVRLGQDAREAGTAVLLLLDEFHSPRPGPELVRLSQALQSVSDEDLPVHVLAAGLRSPAATHTRGADIPGATGLHETWFAERRGDAARVCSAVGHSGSDGGPAGAGSSG